MSTDPVDRLGLALDATLQVILSIHDDQWSLPTPCPDWTVAEVVTHLVAGTHLFAQALGAESARAEGTALPEPGRVDASRRSAQAVLDGVRRPGALEGVVTVPLGSLPGAVALQLRVTEILVHGWDLARATRQPLTIPGDLAREALIFSRAALPAIPPDRHAFAAPQPVPDTAGALDRLAACLGRAVIGGPWATR
ncbi:MAG TPA: TIGR03086 family metal-binding protein [Verrucomicrobiae bacterium]|nr:TIGR03086 family metal-binding protein [Verrucomicrobiae bacterium]